ncbi:hypothetical protein PVAND_014189 [Polypedilum vanderplanki]|uniref:Cytochrome b5 heme-binding domain-containing protein n=1 Tax=Polypedilum vanderplanki TaxID=319348 RepID=A0A9J6CRK9_POLVA|nr:hypothetical protein PVAND_014189 [Polypedilum vanderplanki]
MTTQDYFERISLVKKYPKYRNNFVNGSWKWLEGRRTDDGAYEYWRVHDKLYDLTKFIERHPGGKTWLELTKGTDITEAFESYHLTQIPKELLKEFFISDAAEPRNYRYTYNENGFYQTLKRRVAEKMENIDSRVTNKSRKCHDFVLIAFIITIIFVNRVESNKAYIFCCVLAGQLLAWLVPISYNFLHKADNWRMYSGNLALQTTRDMRIYHMSHHMYPNTYADLEVSTFEPYIKWIPLLEKGWLYKFHLLFVTIITHFIYFHNLLKMRYFGVFWGSERALYFDELVMWIVPFIMIITGGQAVTQVYFYNIFFKWVHVMICTNIFYVNFFMNRGHHMPDLIHQGDHIKSFDFGEYQISTTSDRIGLNRNIFTNLSYYGEQILHHLFPSIDAALLPQLKSTLIDTCKEFNIELKECSIFQSVIGQYKQMFRTEVKTNGHKKRE